MNSIYVETLRDFQTDVEPTRPVRLALTYRTQGRAGFQERVYTLTLSGQDGFGDVIVLTESRSVALEPTGAQPYGLGDQSLAEQIPHWLPLVRAWLTAQGYTVAAGMVALPRDLTQLEGTFEAAAAWQCTERDPHTQRCQAWTLSAPEEPTR